MQQRYNKGVLPVISDEKQLQLLNHAATILGTAGYDRYEISNYSKPGFESQHNLACWRGDDYLGFGPSASSRLGIRRRTNNADLGSYIESLDKNQLPPREEEIVTDDVDVSERFIFGFRLTAGVDLIEFSHKYSVSPEQLSHWRRVLARLVAEGLLLKNKSYYYPTARGLDLADYIASELLA